MFTIQYKVQSISLVVSCQDGSCANVDPLSTLVTPKRDGQFTKEALADSWFTVKQGTKGQIRTGSWIRTHGNKQMVPDDSQ